MPGKPPIGEGPPSHCFLQGSFENRPPKRRASVRRLGGAFAWVFRWDTAAARFCRMPWASSLPPPERQPKRARWRSAGAQRAPFLEECPLLGKLFPQGQDGFFLNAGDIGPGDPQPFGHLPLGQGAAPLQAVAQQDDPPLPVV